MGALSKCNDRYDGEDNTVKTVLKFMLNEAQQMKNQGYQPDNKLSHNITIPSKYSASRAYKRQNNDRSVVNKSHDTRQDIEKRHGDLKNDFGCQVLHNIDEITCAKSLILLSKTAEVNGVTPGSSMSNLQKNRRTLSINTQ